MIPIQIKVERKDLFLLRVTDFQLFERYVQEIIRLKNLLFYICMCVYQVLFAKSSFSVWSTTMTNGILACVVLRVYRPEVERRLNSDVIAAFQDLLELGW